jgi:hypothetical protein
VLSDCNIHLWFITQRGCSTLVITLGLAPDGGIREIEVLTPRSLNLDGGWWWVVSSCLGRFNTGVIASNTHLIERWMYSRVGLNAGEEKNLLPSPRLETTIRRSSPCPISVLTRCLSGTSYIGLSHFSNPQEYWFLLWRAVQGPDA